VGPLWSVGQPYSSTPSQREEFVVQVLLDYSMLLLFASTCTIIYKVVSVFYLYLKGIDRPHHFVLQVLALRIGILLGLGRQHVEQIVGDEYLIDNMFVSPFADGQVFQHVGPIVGLVGIFD
jgi:hypothetical protein